MKYLLLLLLASTARAAPLVQPQDIVGGIYNVAFASGTTDHTVGTAYETIAGSTVCVTAQATSGRLRVSVSASYRSAVSGGDSMHGRILLSNGTVSKITTTFPACADVNVVTNGELHCDIPGLIISTSTVRGTQYCATYQTLSSDGNAVLCADNSVCAGAGMTDRPNWFILLEDLRNPQ